MGLDGEAIAKIQNYQQQSATLLLYQSVLTSDIGQAFLALLEALAKGDKINGSLAYGKWFSALATHQQSWQQHLVTQILLADNAFAQQAQTAVADTPADKLAPGIVAAVHHDLAILQALYHLPAEQLSHWIGQVGESSPPPAMQLSSEPKLPVAFPHQPDWTSALAELAQYYSTHGVGLFGQFRAFRWQSGQTKGQLIGIATPDPIRLAQLIGYDHPKQQLVQNTESLLRGYTAQNVLLYGSRGAGKSSLVKALLNEYSHLGLRLIEVPKSELQNLPQIVEPLRRTPQKFIIFVDDLSFEDDDEAFKALKVVLEGGVTARPQNVVVYATSNRRHLIREFYDERPRPKDAEEIHAWDTLQEKLSFSDRFGLTLTFTPADQPTYLTIVRELAQQAGLNIDPDNLDWRARQWATRHNGRSGRTARQFIDFLTAEQDDQS
ncbi:MAG: ATP-binding protein [Phormidesmis sp.]